MPDKQPNTNGQNVLHAWTALEVLSPVPFDRKGLDILKIDGQKLPWEEPQLQAIPRYRLYYQVIIGSIDIPPAVDALLRVYADSRDERPKARGEAILAAAILDHNGHLIELPAVSVSSFGWGYPKALKGDLIVLQKWAEEEEEVTEQLDKMLRRLDKDSNPIPVDAMLLRSAYSYLVNHFGLPINGVSPPSYAVRVNLSLSIKEPPEPMLLNSFFIKDLIAAGTSLEKGNGTANLKRYLGLLSPASRKQLLSDEQALRAVVSPALTPSGRWPGPNRNPLALLQQAAVNAAMSDLQHGGILAVNGPPGTGKTTLLRDIIAGIVVKRAEALCTFDEPEKAFKAASKISVGNSAFLHLYKLDEKIKGHEILIASSNNKAVENVSVEIPGIKAIASDVAGLRYFKTLSDGLLGKDDSSWGLIAAVLGNATNRSRFKDIFWWNKDVGLQTYLQEATGKPQLVDIVDPRTNQVIGQRPPMIVQHEDPPASASVALQKWKRVRTEFETAVKKSQAKLKELAELEKVMQNFRTTQEREKSLRLQLEKLQKTKVQLQADIHLANIAYQAANQARQQAEQKRREHEKAKPNFILRLFKTSKYKIWKQDHLEQTSQLNSANEVEAKAKKAILTLEVQSMQLQKQIDTVAQDYKPAKLALDSAKQIITKAREEFKEHLLDEDFFSKPHDDRQKMSPWCDSAAQLLRDNVFIAAMEVHKAFIDASAQKVRHNIGALMSAFRTGSLKSDTNNSLLPDLWSTLFLVVPCLSTTFASVERMLGKLPPESLGWLLIDEAGQSLPQAAVGALVRTKKAVVVGDPIQIQPIVVLPETLTRAICQKFVVDAEKYNAPEASVQTLADVATSYYHEFKSSNGDRRVGIPLLVHRRCSSPMFEVSNAIAYDGEMVQAKNEKANASSIKAVLGKSRWIHVEGQSQDKWCLAEGRKVLELLNAIKSRGAKANLYIVTPFVVVAENLRALIRASGVLHQWTDIPEELWLVERIGTVHTVQGREEEAIIFVLGAPMPDQRGSRAWAGFPPNLVNVATTRAKEVLYVVGNSQLWKNTGCFNELYQELVKHSTS